MTVQDIVDALNELFQADPQAIDALLCNRVPANEKLLDHPTAMCSAKNEAGEFPTIGLLGVVQSFVGKEDETIEACYDDERHVLIGFRVRPKRQTKKFTVVYDESWMSGTHKQTTTHIARVKVEFGQCLSAVLKERGIYETALFVLEGWPKHVNSDCSTVSQDENGNP